MAAIENDVQDSRGYDLELIRSSLSQSLEDRLEANRRAAESLLWLQRASLMIRSGKASSGA